MNLNKVTLIGNLAGDPTLASLPSGQAVATFSCATHFRWRDSQSKELKETTEFHHIVAWRRLGEVVAKFLKKGDRVYLEGRLQTRSWKDRQGSQHSRTDVIAERLIMLGGKSKTKLDEKPNTALVEEEISIDQVPLHA